MILIIDNYDSFTYNLVQYLSMLQEEVRVYRNDEISVAGIRELQPDAIVISPGPCTPDEAGISLEAVNCLKGEIPILGICLGHQVIGQAFGGRVIKASEPVHGKVHEISHKNIGVFEGLKNPLKVTRYHSLILERASLPECLEITAHIAEGKAKPSHTQEIMGIKHKHYPIEGVQFHPEAILTEMGLELLKNFCDNSIVSRR